MSDCPDSGQIGAQAVTAGRPAVFLDRDDTILADPGYLADPGAVELLPGAGEALASLRRDGYKLVVVTNQSGIARGLLDESTLAAVNDELRQRLAEHSVRLDGIYYCPYHPEGTVEGYVRDSDLRKPRPGMLLRAAEELDLDLAASWMVGDSVRDVEAGRRAGCGTVLLSADPAAADAAQADHVATDLAAAAAWILRHEGGRGE
jgi:D,D-heptose 1,7-bisphosphate phosphatase